MNCRIVNCLGIAAVITLTGCSTSKDDEAAKAPTTSTTLSTASSSTTAPPTSTAQSATSSSEATGCSGQKLTLPKEVVAFGSNAVASINGRRHWFMVSKPSIPPDSLPFEDVQTLDFLVGHSAESSARLVKEDSFAVVDRTGRQCEFGRNPEPGITSGVGITASQISFRVPKAVLEGLRFVVLDQGKPVAAFGDGGVVRRIPPVSAAAGDPGAQAAECGDGPANQTTATPAVFGAKQTLGTGSGHGWVTASKPVSAGRGVAKLEVIIAATAQVPLSYDPKRIQVADGRSNLCPVRTIDGQPADDAGSEMQLGQSTKKIALTVAVPKTLPASGFEVSVWVDGTEFVWKG